MTDLDATALAELEALRQLKARYCRFLDAKDWTAFRGLFSDDFRSDTSQAGGTVVVGADAFVALVRGFIGAPDQATVHQVHAPELELTSPTTARGIWALEDFVRFGAGLSLRGYGHYHETYEKRDGQWRITASTLTRLREDIVTPFMSIHVTGWLRRLMLRLAARQHARR